ARGDGLRCAGRPAAARDIHGSRREHGRRRARRAGRSTGARGWFVRAVGASRPAARPRRLRVQGRARPLQRPAIRRRAARAFRVDGPLVLDVAGVTKTYPGPRGPLTVLSDVSFSLAPGDAAAITGPSGSGKSSLLFVLGALEPPTSGTVSLDGTNPFALAPDALAGFRNASIGFIFQDHCLLPQCTVLENVLVPTLVGRSNGNERERATDLVARVGLADRIDHRP